MNTHKKLIQLVLVSIALLVSTGPIWANSYGFKCITNNSTANAAIGESQLFVTINAVVGNDNAALFLFGNKGPYASSITDVYFDDGTLLGIASINGSAGVSFSQFANPGNLPGANNATPPFVTTAGFSADSDAPAQPNGVNPGETLEILFNLINGKTYTNTLTAMSTGELRIGIHVQGFANGGSEGFVNTLDPPYSDDNPVPEPATMMGAFMAFGALARYLRKQRSIA